MKAELLKLCKLKKIQQMLSQIPDEVFTYKYCRNLQLKLNSFKDNYIIPEIITLKEYDELNFKISQRIGQSYLFGELQLGKLKFNFHDYMYQDTSKLAVYGFYCTKYKTTINLQFKNKKLNKLTINYHEVSVKEFKEMKYLLNHLELLAFQ